jgi:hypothetical protein
MSAAIAQETIHAYVNELAHVLGLRQKLDEHLVQTFEFIRGSTHARDNVTNAATMTNDTTRIDPVAADQFQKPPATPVVPLRD